MQHDLRAAHAIRGGAEKKPHARRIDSRPGRSGTQAPLMSSQTRVL